MTSPYTDLAASLGRTYASNFSRVSVRTNPEHLDASRRDYVSQMKIAHDVATVFHLAGQEHGAAIAKIANGDVPMLATLPGIGPLGALSTAPAGHGLEGALRSWAGGALGTPVGMAGGAAGGAGLGALAAALGAGGEGVDHEALSAAMGLGAMAGGGVGGLAGSMLGSRAALAPIYAAGPKTANHPYDDGTQHAPPTPRSTGIPSALIGAGALGGLGAAVAADPHLADAPLRALGASPTTTSTDGVITGLHNQVPTGPSAPGEAFGVKPLDGFKPDTSELEKYLSLARFHGGHLAGQAADAGGDLLHRGVDAGRDALEGLRGLFGGN